MENKPVLAFYNVEEIAEIYGVCVRSVAILVARGDIPPPDRGGNGAKRWWRKAKINHLINEI